MADWPLQEGQRAEVTAMANEASSTIITSNALANMKGLYSELIASTAFDAKQVVVMFQDANSGKDFLVDVAIGADLFEQVIFENLSLCSGNGLGGSGYQYNFLVGIPAGTRIAARCQDTTGGTAVRISCLLLSQGFLPSQPLSRVETIGAATADSGGTSIDPGATVNTKGAYTQLVASTAFPYRAMILAFPNQTNGVRTNARVALDVAIGAAASETIVIPDYAFNLTAVQDAPAPGSSVTLPCSIPAGSRVAARAACSTADATDRLFDVILYGVG